MNKKLLIQECVFDFSRSSGAGGQNVNKVNTRVELRFNVLNSMWLTDAEKALVMTKLKNRINQHSELVLTSQVTRSQLKNKELVIERFIQLVERALEIQAPRIGTKPRKSAVAKRLKTKKIASEIKKMRQSPDF
jgi:ribosome-associated protein